MRIHHIAISVRDKEVSASFYIKSFGFKEIKRFTKPGWDGEAVILELDDLQLEIFEFKGTKERSDDLSDLKVMGLKHIGIEVGDVNAKYKELKNNGADIDEPVKGTTCAWFCFVRDPDDIPLELYESK